MKCQILDLGLTAGITRDGAELQDLIAIITLLAEDEQARVPEPAWRELMAQMETNGAEVPPPSTSQAPTATPMHR